MKYLIVIGCWMVELVLLATIIVSMGYRFAQALMLASMQGHVLEGTVMLRCYSLGLGIPFFISAMLIDKLKGAFSFIKSHYRGINLVCGLLLVLMGILMAVGVFGKFLTLLS